VLEGKGEADEKGALVSTDLIRPERVPRRTLSPVCLLSEELAWLGQKFTVDHFSVNMYEHPEIQPKMCYVT